MRAIKLFIQLCTDSLKHLLKNDPLRMAGATAFFTTFSLPPILLLLVQVFKWIVGPELIRHQLFVKLSATFGIETVRQLVDVLRAIRRIADRPWVTIGGFIFLLFVITTLFRVFKNSINQLWKIRHAGKETLARSLGSRVKSLAVLMTAGILFIIAFAAEALQTVVGAYLTKWSPQVSALFTLAIGRAISTVVVMCWFAIVFRYLPDGRPTWKVSWVGALLTSILFGIGQSIMHALLTYSNINNIYGASASMVLLLLFVFYTALILYFGACFTRQWAIHKGTPIQPLPHAVSYKIMTVDAETNESI
ncbi:MAG: YihY/virulence factor BrkB family protein [Bacteroidetes bacterium]|nr:YihY/virulence factor BrkB family protein [Bacteroidota bacterium]